MHAAATLAMVGLIWFVQIVHYPLFAQVPRDHFTDYEKSHQRRTTIVVAPIMLVEAFTSMLLLWLRPEGVPMRAIVAGVCSVGLVWTSNFFLQVPAHARLEDSYDETVLRWLVRSNWVRTAAWSGRGLLVCWMIGEMVF